MSVEVRCTGCGERLPLPSDSVDLQGKELLESLQKSPPFCVVCSCRTVAGPRPGVEVWEPIREVRNGYEPPSLREIGCTCGLEDRIGDSLGENHAVGCELLVAIETIERKSEVISGLHDDTVY